MEKVVPFRTGYGSGLFAAWYDGSFLFVFFRLSSAQSAVAHCNSDPVHYVDMWGLTASDKGGNDESNTFGKINWGREIAEIFSGTEVGLVWKGGISIPNVANLEAGISLGSVSYDITNGNEYKQGASLDFSLGKGPMTIYNSSFSYERSSSGSCVLDLIGKDFETDYESSNSATITLPIPGFAITIDIEEVVDLTEKICDSIWN